MPEHQRLVKLVVMPIMGRFSEDGDLLGEEQLPGEVVYHPYAQNLLDLVGRLEQKDRQRSGGKRGDAQEP